MADRPGRRLGCPHLRKDRIAKKIDAAFFGNTVSNGPSGLLSLTGINEIDTDAYPFSSLDPVHQAKAAALADGAEITVWVLAPDVALALSTTKEFNPGETSDATSNRGLLDANGVSDGTLLAGLPVLVTTDVGAGNAWGLGSSQVLVVQRTGTKVNPSTDSVFDYDAVQVRATAPVLFGFPNPAGVADLRHRLVHPRRCRPVTRPGPSGPLRPGDSP